MQRYNNSNTHLHKLFSITPIFTFLNTDTLYTSLASLSIGKLLWFLPQYSKDRENGDSD